MTTGTKLASRVEIFELAYFVLANASNTEKVSKIDVVVRLSEFSELHDLSAMARFLKYGKENGMTDSQISATIIHDLNGMNDTCFSPKTSSY
jgi:predicted nucleic acid-binding protein